MTNCFFLCFSLLTPESYQEKAESEDILSESWNKYLPVSEEILDLLETEKYKKYVDYYKQHVEYVDDIKNPTGIYKKVKDFMSSKGKFHYKKVKIKDEKTQVFRPINSELFVPLHRNNLSTF